MKIKYVTLGPSPHLEATSKAEQEGFYELPQNELDTVEYLRTRANVEFQEALAAEAETVTQFAVGAERLNSHEIGEAFKTIVEALVGHYEKYHVRPEDFSLLEYPETPDGKTVAVVAYAAANGIDLGNPNSYYDERRSWNSIMHPGNKEHIVEIDGVICDTRQGMTSAAYRALVELKKATGQELPDSKDNAIEGYDIEGWHTQTWHTGERRVFGQAPVSCVLDNGYVRQDYSRKDDNALCMRFRPAVIIYIG